MNAPLTLETALDRAAYEGIAANFTRWARFVGYREGDWLELQALGVQSPYGQRVKFAHAGSLNAAIDLLTVAERFTASGLYCIANRINDAVATRRKPGAWHDAGKGMSTSDRDIVARRVIVIDIDAKRPSGTSATDEELARTVPVARAVFDKLTSLLGSSSALGVGHSGNGRQVFIAIEESCESEMLANDVKSLLGVMSSLFSTGTVQLDASVGDAKRLVPAFGTLKRKGAPDIMTRPHRPTAFICGNDVMRASANVLRHLITKLGNVELLEKSSLRRSAGTNPPDVVIRPAPTTPFQRANAMPIAEVAERLQLSVHGNLRCPGCDNTEGVGFIGNGLKCHHASCAGKGKTPGYRTPVDLVAEVRGISPKDAVQLMALWGGFEAHLKTPVRGNSSKAAPALVRNRARIILGVEERRVANDAINALASFGADIYQRGGRLVHVVQDGRPRIVTLAPPTLREWMAHSADWIEVRERKFEPQEVSVHPPRWCVDAVHARGGWEGIRPLRAAIEFPVLRPDGTVLSMPGYDAATELLYVPNYNYDDVTENPSKAEALEARDLLLDVVRDFPFKTEKHRSAYLATVLTPFARYMFDGAVPSVLIDGNTPGAGKGLLANVLGIIVTGRELDVRPEIGCEEEFRKRVTSIARTGDPLILIDNVTKPLGGGTLDAVLTARSSWSDRGMGTFDEVRTPMVGMWIFTGNNVEFRRKDTQRRCLQVRLESNDENPENRGSFHYDPLLPWVQINRRRLVSAALTFLRAYVVAGMPQSTLSAWGSFDEWSRVIRQAVVWGGSPDPYLGQSLSENGDAETSALLALFTGWEDVTRGICTSRQGCTVAEFLIRLQRDDDTQADTQHPKIRDSFSALREALSQLSSTPSGQFPNAHRLGCILRRFRGRVIGGKKLMGSVYNGNNVWRIDNVSSTGIETSETNSTSL